MIWDLIQKVEKILWQKLTTMSNSNLALSLKETIVSSQILKLNMIHQVFKYYQLNQN
nr:MAG TPA: hypothetical protein [Crassvirales sp.]